MRQIYIPEEILQEIFSRSKTEKISRLYREFNLQDTISYAQLCARIRTMRQQKEGECSTQDTASSQGRADVLLSPSPTPFRESFLRRLARAIKCILS